jgi:ABC-type transport system involved in multi-copper enzyme maturation permease subunit
MLEGFMRTLYSLLGIEMKRLFCLRNILLILLVLGLCYNLVIEGNADKKELFEKEKSFIEFEIQKFQEIPNYFTYSNFGFDLIFIPSQFSVIFKGGVFSDITAHINNNSHMQIFENLRGQAIFKKKNSLSMDFSGIIQIFGILFAILYGFEAMRYREYSKTLSSLCSPNKLFLLTILTRVAILIVLILAVYGSVLLFTAIYGLNVSTSVIEIFLKHAIAACLMGVFFFFSGLIVGMAKKNKWIGITAMLIIVGTIVFIVPAVINNIVMKEAAKIESDYKREIEKQKLLIDFEKEVIKKLGKFSPDKIELFKELAEKYYKEEYPKIESINKMTRDEIANVVNKHKNISVWTPTTFYDLTTDELSSQDYENFLAFLDYVIEIKRKFLRFWIDRVYYNDPKDLVCFVKGDENIYRGTSKLGNQFWTSVLINSVYIVILFFASFIVFSLSLFHMKENEVKEAGTLEMEFDSGYFESFLTRDNLLVKLLYNLFSGHTAMLVKKGLNGEVSVNDADILKEKYSEKFFFICRPEDIPRDIRVKDLFSFIGSLMRIPKKGRNAVLEMPTIKNIADKRFKTLNQEELFHAALALTYLVKSPLYLINDIAGGKDKEYTFKLMERVHQLKKENAIIIYLATPTMITDIPMPEGKSFTDGRTWFYISEGNRLANEGKENEDAGEE